MASSHLNIGLDELRRRIDGLDDRIVALLNERAQVVVAIGQHKQQSGGAIYAPHREAAVLKRVLDKNQGPLSDRCVEGVYRELMSGSFALERPLQLGCLGPEGSHSHAAARLQFGGCVQYQLLPSIEAVFLEVQRGHVDYGIVPIENSAGGSIQDTLDACQKYSGTVFAYAEVQTQVHHHLIAHGDAKEVHTIYSKPEVFSQCRRWVQDHYPQAELVSTPSSSYAVQKVAQSPSTSGLAAIGSRLAAQRYQIPIVVECVEDMTQNLTRFFVLSRQKAAPSGDDKTSLICTTLSQPGALAKVLQRFADSGINLTHIDKRPSGHEPWTYTFFIDAQGHAQDPAFARTLEVLSRDCKELSVLGSYPRSRRVL